MFLLVTLYLLGDFDMKKLLMIFGLALLVSVSFAAPPCLGIADDNVPEGDSIGDCAPPPPPSDCLVVDTVITLADGQTAFIQDIFANQQLVTYTSEDNLIASVAAAGVSFNSSVVNFVSNRAASESMFELVDTLGNSLKGTGNHPIITVNRGVVPMGQLQVGDTLVTLYGESQVASLTAFDYEGSVHNIALGDFNHDAADLEASISERTFFANNILVGDLNLQYALGN